MMRVAHFSDLHYAGATLTEVDRCFSFAVDAAIARGVDCAVISGIRPIMRWKCMRRRWRPWRATSGGSPTTARC